MRLRTAARCITSIVIVSLLLNTIAIPHTRASTMAYLIVIETEQLRDAVQPLVDLAIYKGYVPIVECAPPYAPGETDRSVAVRQWLTSKIGVSHAAFVVLVGHPYDASRLSQHDTGGLLPMRYMYPDPMDHSFDAEGRTQAMTGAVPTDAWYLNGSSWNWDKDGDGFAGEQGEDVLSTSGIFAVGSYALGRIPFSDAGTVRKVCDGIARAEMALQMAGPPRALVTAAIYDFRNGSLGPVARDGAAVASALAATLRQQGVPTTTLFEREGVLPSRYASDGGLDRYTVKQELARGPWSVAFFCGHGGTQRSWWASDTNGDHLFNETEESIDTQYWNQADISFAVGLALVSGCATAIMDGASVRRGPEVSSLLVEGRAACCVGSTRITWGALPDDTGEMSAAQLDMFASLSGFTDSAASAFTRATDRNLRQSDNPGTALWNAYAYGVYGDPSYVVLPERVSPCVPDAPYLAFEGAEPSQLALKNTTSEPLTWQLEDVPPWLAASSQMGTIAPGTTTTVRFSVPPETVDHDQNSQLVIVSGATRYPVQCHLHARSTEELSVTLRDEFTTWIPTLRFSGIAPPGVTQVGINGQLMRIENDGRFSRLVNLKEGDNLIDVTAQLADHTVQVVRHVFLKPLERPIEVFTEDGLLTSQSSVLIRGRWLPNRDVAVSGVTIRTSEDGSFAATVPLSEGANSIRIAASGSSVPAVTRCVIVARTDSPLLPPSPVVPSQPPRWSAGAIRALAVRPGDPSTIVVSVGDPGCQTEPGSAVLKTTDGGLTWRRLDLLPAIDCLAYDCFQPDTLYAGGIFGSYRSVDGGMTWDIPSDQKGIRGIAADPNTPGVVWAATASGLLRSEDSGESWTLLGEPVDLSGLAVAKGQPATIVRMLNDGYPGSVQVSPDGGAHWKTDPDTLQFRGCPTADPSSANTFWAARADQVCVSADGGNSWCSLPCSPSTNPNPVFWSPGVALATCADVPGAAYMTWYGPAGWMLLRTLDGGRTWAEVNLPQASIIGVAADEGGLVLASAGDGVVHVSRDAGDTWIHATVPDGFGLETLAVGTVGGKKQAVATGLARAAVSVDGGQHWKQQALPIPDGTKLLHPTLALAANRLILSGLSNCIYELGANGAWQAIGSLPAAVSVGSPGHGVKGVAFDGRALYIAAGIDGLYSSIDGGVSWTTLKTGDWASIEGVYVSDRVPGLVFAAALGPQDLLGVPVTNDLLVSRDYGSSWVSAGLTGTTVRKVVFDPYDPSVMYAVSSGDAWRTEDAGHRWVPLELPDFDFEITDAAALGDGRLLLSTAGGLIFSDAGAHAPQLSLAPVSTATLDTMCFLGCEVVNNFQHLTRTFTLRASDETLNPRSVQPQPIPVTLKPGESQLVQVPWVPEGASPRTARVTVTLSDGQGSVLTHATTEVQVSPRLYTLTVNHVGLGSVTQIPVLESFTAGSTVTLTAIPAPHYAFTGWSGVPTGTANPAVVTMDSDKSVTATFELIPNPPAAVNTLTLTLQMGNMRMLVSGSDGRTDTVMLDAAPILGAGNRTLIPIRAVAEAMAGTVDWDAATKTATVAVGSNTLELTLGKNTALFNGTPKRIDSDPKVVPVIINGRTMLPLRFVAESLGAVVSYDQTTKTITITCTKS